MFWENCRFLWGRHNSSMKNGLSSLLWSQWAYIFTCFVIYKLFKTYFKENMVLPYLGRTLTPSFYSFVLLHIRPLAHPSTHSPIYPLSHPSIHPFIHPSNPSAPSCIHPNPFIYPLLTAYTSISPLCGCVWPSVCLSMGTCMHMHNAKDLSSKQANTATGPYYQQGIAIFQSSFTHTHTSSSSSPPPPSPPIHLLTHPSCLPS